MYLMSISDTGFLAKATILRRVLRSRWRHM